MKDISAFNPKIIMGWDPASPGGDKAALAFRQGDKVLAIIDGEAASVIGRFIGQLELTYGEAVSEAQHDTWTAQQAIIKALEAHGKCDGVHYAATLGVSDPLLEYIKSLNLPTDEENTDGRPN